MIGSEPRTACEQMQTTYARFSTVFPGLCVNLSPTGQIELANQELLNYFGRSLDEINAWAMTDAIHPDYLPDGIDHHTRSMTTGTPYDFDFRCRRADGVYLWFQARNLPMHDSYGMITGCPP